MYYPQNEVQTTINYPDVKNIFNTIVNECPRSATKRNLHPDSGKDQLLAQQLEQVINKYGQEIASQFQSVYEKQNPALSFLFAQVTNAVLEKTFHEGRCHLQAAYSLIELCKKNVFNASLVCSRTDNPATEHWYLIIPDDYTFKTLSQMPQIYVRVEPNRFNKEATFFDTWSNQLCQWQVFQPEPNNEYTKAIKKSPQAMFRPLVHLFGNNISVLENIIWCLTEYEKRLKKLAPNMERGIQQIPEPLKLTDDEFQNEMELLVDSGKCLSKLLSTIDHYKSEFTAVLNSCKEKANKRDQNVPTEQNIKEKDERLSSLTSSFFKKPVAALWKEYPQTKLANTKYAGHQMRFFTMKDDMSQAGAFVDHLIGKGVKVELKEANGKPSIVADLTESTFTYK